MSREKRVVFACTRCRGRYEKRHIGKCEHCGSAVDPVYDLSRAQINADAGSYLERYFDLLPLEHMEQASGGREPTPVVKARTLGRRYKLKELWLKDETVNPTRTTKDRMAACSLSRFRELEIKAFVASSTGNSSTSFGRWIEQHGKGKMHAHLFCGSTWFGRHQHCAHDDVTLTAVDGTFVEASAAAQQYAAIEGLVWEGGFFNPCRREGLKTAYLEAFDQMPRQPSVVVQAVSSGMGIYGAWRGAKEYHQLGRLRWLPRLVCIQQSSCAPMVHSFERGASEMCPEFVLGEPEGIAEAILRGDPSGSYPYICKIVKESRGTFRDVSREEIEETQQLLFEDEGLRACPASAAAVAGVTRLRSESALSDDDVILVNLAGGIRSADDEAPTGHSRVEGRRNGSRVTVRGGQREVARHEG
jgi:threonine synthase